MSKGNIFAQIAREGRKFRTGLCAVSQQPKLISNEVISQFNTLCIMGLADRRDREIPKDSARQDIGQLDNEIQMLMPGEGLITSPKSPFALPVKVFLYEDLLRKRAEQNLDAFSPEPITSGGMGMEREKGRDGTEKRREKPSPVGLENFY